MSKNNFNDAVYINAEALELELARFLDKKAAHTQATILTPLLNKAFLLLALKPVTKSQKHAFPTTWITSEIFARRCHHGGNKNTAGP